MRWLTELIGASDKALHDFVRIFQAAFQEWITCTKHPVLRVGAVVLYLTFLLGMLVLWFGIVMAVIGAPMMLLIEAVRWFHGYR